MKTTEAMTTLDLPGLIRVGSGKVREIFDLGDRLLMVASDRISAFDFILPNGIPDKGKILTQISNHWFAFTSDIVENHLLESDVRRFPEELRGHAEILAGRSMIVKKARMFPVECVVRGYLAGSGYKEYKATRSTSGVSLPPGLELASKLPELIFTPAIKATSGHDENISFDRMVSMIGKEDAAQLRDLSLAVFQRASEHAETAGIIIADTKFEFGRLDDGNGEIILCDEVLTPDSSRFWDRETYRTGISPPSFDKQFVRDHLEESRWDKMPPVPELPAEIVEGTRRRYLDIFKRLTGRDLA
jgi:phosphoribosylaminoimidazole-succinocarboxamide synthase